MTHPSLKTVSVLTTRPLPPSTIIKVADFNYLVIHKLVVDGANNMKTYSYQTEENWSLPLIDRVIDVSSLLPNHQGVKIMDLADVVDKAGYYKLMLIFMATDDGQYKWVGRPFGACCSLVLTSTNKRGLYNALIILRFQRAAAELQVEKVANYPRPIIRMDDPEARIKLWY